MRSEEMEEESYSRSPEQISEEEESPNRPARSQRTPLWVPEFVPWKEELRPQFLEAWKSTGDGAEHVYVIGTTGSGKTTLVLDILRGTLNKNPKARAIILMNKKKDTTMRGLVDTEKIAHIKKWDDLAYKHRVKRLIVLWPDYPDSLTEARKQAIPVFREALDGIMEEGDWIVYIDEASYMIEQLRLRIDLDEYWNSARSNGISVVSGGQRPVWVSKSMTSQHSWVFTFKIKDLDDRRSVGQNVGDRRDVPIAIGKLQHHEFLLIQTNEDVGYVSNVKS